MTSTFDPNQNWNSSQLNASSAAATHSGIPINVLRGVTGYKYGPSATAADFTYVAGQLAGWYTHFYKLNGNALVSWQQAAGQEMGSGASAFQIAQATAAQSEAATGLELAPGFAGIFGDVGQGVASTITDVTDLAGSTDTTGVSDTGGIGGVGAQAASTAESTGTASSTDAGAAASGAAGAGSTASTLLKAGGLAGLLGATGWSELLIRALEALAGAALILLGLSALTGNSDGNPVSAVKTAGRHLI